MQSKGKFVFLGFILGLFGYAVAAAIAGYVFDMMGDRHPHGPGPVLVALIAMLYFAPIGAVIGLVSSMILKDRSLKKIWVILAVSFVLIIAALVAYVKLLTGR